MTIEVLDPGPSTAEAMAVGGPAETKVAGVTPDLLASIPRRISDKQGNPGDMVNILIVGTKEQVLHAFSTAGWVRVDSDVQSTVIAGLIDTIQKKDYLTMPMSTLYLFNRPQDYGFAHAEPVRVAMSRNHLRAWQSSHMIGGRPVWCIAATHDIGFERDERNNGVTHKIDSEIDKEREYVNDTLSGTGMVAAREHIAPPDPLTEARTATGGTFRSDGRILILVLDNTKITTTDGQQVARPILPASLELFRSVIFRIVFAAVLRCSKIGRGRGSQCFSKHGNKRAWRAVTCFQSRMRHLRPFREKLHRPHQPQLLPPFSKRHPRVLLEETLDGPLARATQSAKFGKRPRIARVVVEHLHDAARPRVRHIRKLQRYRLYRVELIQNYFHQVSLL